MQPANPLQTGVKAPPFSFTNREGKVVSTADLLGKRWILYFYPRDNTPGCTKEACSFRNAWEEMQTHGIDVLGCSPDSQESHDKFRQKLQINYTLVPDTDKKIAKQYGVWGEKQFMGKRFEGVHRITFLISSDGSIAHVFTKVKPDKHAESILSLLDELQWN